MKNLSFLLLFSFCFGFYSCNKSCKSGDKEIPCQQLETYKTFLTHEANINATFNELAPKLSSTEELALRQKLLSFYDSNKTEIAAAYEIIGSYGSKPEEIYEMRLGEIAHFKEKIVEEAFTAEFIKKLEIKESVEDTCFYEDCDKQKYLIWIIKNTSDSTITSIAINQNYEKDGNLKEAKQPTYYLFSTDQITPALAEEEKVVLKPGSTLLLSFEHSAYKVPKPLIQSIQFAKK